MPTAAGVQAGGPSPDPELLAEMRAIVRRVVASRVRDVHLVDDLV